MILSNYQYLIEFSIDGAEETFGWFRKGKKYNRYSKAHLAAYNYIYEKNKTQPSSYIFRIIEI